MEDVFQVTWLILVRFTVTAFLGPHLRGQQWWQCRQMKQSNSYKLRKHLQGRQPGRVDTVHMHGGSLGRAICALWALSVIPPRLSHPLTSAVTSESVWNQTPVGTLSLDSETRSFPSVPLNSKCGQKQREAHGLVLFSVSQSKLPTEGKTKLWSRVWAVIWWCVLQSSENKCMVWPH